MISVPSEWERWAADGNGQFAIAIALLKIGRAIEVTDMTATSEAIVALGHDICRKFTAISDALDSVANAIREHE